MMTTSNRVALITGITGQDGYYLSKILLDKGYKVYGFFRKKDNPFPFFGDDEIWKEIKPLYGDMFDFSSIATAVRESKPDEVYNLAAISDIKSSQSDLLKTMRVNYKAVGELLYESFKVNTKVRFCQASSAQVFSRDNTSPQSEFSKFGFTNPYGESKLKADQEYIVAGREYGAFACSAFLFNHESPFRGNQFVTRKITETLVKIKLGILECLELGNLDLKRDWGFAGDYVEAMWLMLQQDTPEDFVIATGENHSVREFVEEAGRYLGIPITWEGKGLKEVGKDKDGRIIIKINKDFYKPNETFISKGDFSKAQNKLGWKPKVSFEELVRMMTDHDLKILS